RDVQPSRSPTSQPSHGPRQCAAPPAAMRSTRGHPSLIGTRPTPARPVRAHRHSSASPQSHVKHHACCVSANYTLPASMAETTIPPNALHSFLDPLDKANVRTAAHFPGDSPARQPVHTVYGGAHLFKADAAQKLGAVALKSLEEHAPDATTLAGALALDLSLADRIYLRVIDKLAQEPIEDFRIDFEDGFGNRPDDEEDRFAHSAADEVAAGFSAHTLPTAIGIRIKPLNEELKRRSLRT